GAAGARTVELNPTVGPARRQPLALAANSCLPNACISGGGPTPPRKLPRPTGPPSAACSSYTPGGYDPDLVGPQIPHDAHAECEPPPSPERAEPRVSATPP